MKITSILLHGENIIIESNLQTTNDRIHSHSVISNIRVSKEVESFYSASYEVLNSNLEDYSMNNKKKRLAERRSASKEIRRVARGLLHDLTIDPEFVWEDETIKLYPWWEDKKISQIGVIQREHSY